VIAGNDGESEIKSRSKKRDRESSGIGSKESSRKAERHNGGKESPECSQGAEGDS